jgi:hypothetical protein
MKTEPKIYKERIKFYADTGIEQNKLFTWELPKGILSIKDTLNRFFSKGWRIRAAWYEKIDLTTGRVIENTPLKVNELLDEYIEAGLSPKKPKNSY